MSLLSSKNNILDIASQISQKAYGYSTGFLDMDKALMGLHNSELTIIAARSSMGKTSLLSNIVARSAMQVPQIVFSLEMPSVKLFERMLADVSEIPYRKLKEGTALSEKERQRYEAAIVKLENRPIYIEDRSKVTPEFIRKCCERVAEKMGPEFIVHIDYLQLMSADNFKTARYLEVDEIVSELRGIAKDFDIPIVATCQLNREVERRNNHEPRLSDLRECLAIDSSYVYDWSEGSPMVLSKGEKEVAPEKATYIEKKSNAVYRVKTRSGRFVDATANHLILCDTGEYKKVKDLSEKDSLVCPLGWEDQSKNEYFTESLFLGLMIGNGCMCKYNASSFDTQHGEIADLFLREVKSVFNVTPNKRKQYKDRNVLSFEIPNYLFSMRDWFKDRGMWGYKAYDKHIPQWFMSKANKPSWRKLICGLWHSDGGLVRMSCGKWHFKYHTTSQKLANQILYGLAHLGIFATINEVPIRGKMKHKAWEILITDGWRQKFIDQIELFGNRKPIGLEVKTGNYSNRYSEQVSKTMCDQLGIRYQNKRLGYWGTDPLKDPITVPDAITSITKVGVKKVFDLSVKPSHNFTVNGLIVHNSGSIEQAADTVILLHRPAYYKMKEIDLELEDDGEAYAFVAKQRNGATGKIPLIWIPEFMAFRGIGSLDTDTDSLYSMPAPKNPEPESVEPESVEPPSEEPESHPDPEAVPLPEFLAGDSEEEDESGEVGVPNPDFIGDNEPPQDEIPF